MTAMRGDGGARRDGGGRGAAGDGREGPGGGLLRSEGLGRDRELRGVDASVAGYVGSQRLVFATRVGGRALWGEYPWFESAQDLGRGPRRPRLLRRSVPRRLVALRQRRAAVAARPPQGRCLPLRWGLNTFVESGRVWYAGEDSQRWHAGYGVGLMLQLIGTPMALSGSIAHGTEGASSSTSRGVTRLAALGGPGAGPGGSRGWDAPPVGKPARWLRFAGPRSVEPSRSPVSAGLLEERSVIGIPGTVSAPTPTASRVLSP